MLPPEQYTVLVVEDSAEDLATYQRYLQRDRFNSYQLHTAVYVAAGLEWCETQWPDAILLDFLLPDLNGSQFITKLQQLARGRALPAIIVLTGQGNEEIAVTLMKQGVADYLSKDKLTEQGLQSTLHQVLKRSRVQQALELEQQRQQAIAATALRIRRSLALAEILQSAVSEIKQFLSCDRVIVYQFAPDWSGTVVAEAVEPEYSPALGAQIIDTCFVETNGQPYRQGRHKTIDDIYRAGLSECHIRLLAEFQVRALLVVPLLLTPDNPAAPPKLWGLLIAHQCRSTRNWPDSHMLFLDRLAVQLGIAIQQAELVAQLQQRERDLHIFLEIATDAMLVRDLTSRIRFWNKGAERIYGWSAAEALDRDANTLFYPAPLVGAATALETVLQQGEWQGELQKMTKTGQIAIVYSRWTLVRDESGNPIEILSVDTDITEKKQLEAQFLRVQRLESLGTLASGIAHDMNNILTPILTASQLLPLRLKNIDDRSRSLLRMLEESAKRGTNLVQQILSFARGSDGTRTAVQIRHLLAEVVSVARQTFPKSIEIELRLATTHLWSLTADVTQLHQVLMNLLVNARDAMPDGGILTVAAENLELDLNYVQQHPDARVGNYVMVAVADTGMGISPEILARIFEPFFTTKPNGKGTGLGLSTTLSIVKSHGGFALVESDVGQGTRFEIYLPAVEIVEIASPLDMLDLPLGNGESILVVDDEVSVREILKATLETYNYRVITANDGMQGIATFTKYQAEIRAILFDLMMPALNSAAAIRTLQRIDPDVEIVVMSGLAADELSENISDVRVAGCLAKPFTSQELLQTLAGLLMRGN
jgi:two-component system, cell cycle sensor histidine kinase and response regulator CckA